MKKNYFDFSYLKKLSKLSNGFILGSDEVGRGPLAGPVVAASVLIHWEGDCPLNEISNYFYQLDKNSVNDSKSLSSVKRKIILQSLEINLSEFKNKKVMTIYQNKNLKIKAALWEVNAEEIDQLNILRASLFAMKKSMELCCQEFSKKDRGIWLIDGSQSVSKYWGGSRNIKEEKIIKGDQKSKLMALASIIAKEYRDQLMKDWSKLYPHYGLEKNAGYPTRFHRAAITKYGITPIHRKSFRGVVFEK